MEQIEIKLGERKSYSEYEDSREIVRFTGEKMLQLPDPNHRNYIRFTLYECPNGYRVLVELDIELRTSSGGIHFSALAPPHRENKEDYLLTGEEVRSKFPCLSTTAGKVQNLDETRIASAENRERVARFAKIMRLVHSR